MKLIARKDTRVIVFALFSIIVIGITSLNIYLNRNIKTGENVDQLKKENIKLLEENIKIKKQLAFVAPTNQENDRQKHIALAEKFINLTMLQKKEGFSERRAQAQSIMSPELFELFYPQKTFEHGDDYSSTPSDMKFYLQSYQPLKDEVSLIAEFNISLLSNEKTKPETTHNVIEMTIKKQNNDKWLVTSISEISIEII